MKPPSHTRVLALALGKARFRRAAAISGLLYLPLYLYAVGQLVVGRGAVSPGGSPAFVVAPDWAGKLFEPIAGYSFEPVAALYLFEGLALFLAPVNLAIGAVVGGLVALNVATAWFAIHSVRSCRRLSWFGLLGSLPALFSGFACCAPTVALVLGANVGLALIGVQTFLLPASVFGLLAGLFWNLHRTRRELSA